MNAFSALLVIAAISDLVVPVAGNWRGTRSTLRLANQSAKPATVSVKFVPPSGEPLRLTLGPREKRTIDVGAAILRGTEAVGALRIESDAVVAADVVLDAGSRGGTFAAVPMSAAIGTGESASIGAPALGTAQFRLFVAETRGLPLYFSATVTQEGRQPLHRRLYVAGGAQSTNALDFDIDRSRPFALELHGINGSGRIIAAAATVGDDKAITAFPMTQRTGVRHTMPPAEIVAYALALAAVAFYTWKSRVSSAPDVQRARPLR